MSRLLKPNKISKEDFFNINEKDVMFITNPGRMGDEDGSTFIVKQDNSYKVYRVDEWMYRGSNFNESEHISLEDTRKQFPKWFEQWENCNNEDYKGKYTYLYMGYGNGLSVDNSIYDEFKPYLDQKIEEYLKRRGNDEHLKFIAVFDVWEEAFIDMVNNKNIVEKK